MERFIFWLIIANIVVMVLETVGPLFERYRTFFLIFDAASVAVFTVEYVARVYLVPRQNPGVGGGLGRVRFAFTPLALVDLAAIVPFFVPFLLPVDLRFLRAMRLLRIARVFKLGRYSKAFVVVLDTIRGKREELLIALSLVSGLLVIASSVMYLVERDVQPEVFGSIPAAMWWGVATLTTVGYGDVFPVTALGRVFGAVTAITCIGLFALPAGILASGFAEAVSRQEPEARACPHCGGEIRE